MQKRVKSSKVDIFATMLCVVFLFSVTAGISQEGSRHAKEILCAANLHKWGEIWNDYVRDHEGSFPSWPLGEYSETSMPNWPVITEPYYKNHRLLLCPEARKTYAEGGQNPHLAWRYEFEKKVYRGSYTVNLWASNGEDDDDRYWRRPCSPGAAQAPLMLGGQWKDMLPFPDDEPAPFEESLLPPGRDELQRTCVNRHNGVNVLFIDGVVRKVGLKDLWVRKWHRQWPQGSGHLPQWPEWMANFKDP